MSIKVKSCPFCGGDVEVNAKHEYICQGWMIELFGFKCKDCKVLVKVYPKEPFEDITMEDAIKCYNRRYVHN